MGVPEVVDEVILATAGYDHTIKFWQVLDTRCQPGKINSKDVRTEFCRRDRSLLFTRRFHKFQFYKHINFFLSHLLHILKRDSFWLREKKKGSFFFFFFSVVSFSIFLFSAADVFCFDSFSFYSFFRKNIVPISILSYSNEVNSNRKSICCCLSRRRRRRTSSKCPSKG